VIDYKTGTATRQMKSPRTGPFNGGRQLQPAIYHAAVEAILGRPVSSFEYRFPTARGGNETVGYTGEELAAVPALVSSLLAHVHAGEFIATTDAADCSYCNYGGICRAERGRFNATTSPRAAWAKEHGPSLPQYVAMLARRSPAVES
jgi:hypothetical protein